MRFFTKVALITFALTSFLFAENVNKVKGVDLATLNTIGSKDAPIVIYNFTSLACVHCKNFHETVFSKLKENYIDKGLVQYKLVLINNGEVSNAAAVAFTYLAKNNDEFYRNASLMLGRQNTWAGKKAKVYELALSVNITKSQVNNMLNDSRFLDTSLRLNGLARDANVRGTPTLVIVKKGGNVTNPLDKIEGNPGYGKIREKIELALTQASKK